MQTFQLSAMQRRNFRAMRVFVMLHLLGAAGLVLLMDAAREGIGATGMTLVALLLAATVLPARQLIAARRGLLNGHIVVTRKTAALCAPGAPRVFIRKRDCLGYAPARLALLDRDRRHHRLRLPGGQACCRDAFVGIVRAWWPDHAASVAWEENIAQTGDRFLPLEVYFPESSRTPGRRCYRVDARNPAACLLPMAAASILVLANFLVGAYLVRTISAVDTSGAASMEAVLAAPLFLVAIGAIVYLIREIHRTWFTVTAFIAGPRTLGVVGRDRRMAFYRAATLESYNPDLGLLYFRDAPPILAAPWFFGPSYRCFTQSVIRRWRPEVNVADLNPFRNHLRRALESNWPLCLVLFLSATSMPLIWVIPFLTIWLAWHGADEVARKESIDLDEATGGSASRHGASPT